MQVECDEDGGCGNRRTDVRSSGARGRCIKERKPPKFAHRPYTHFISPADHPIRVTDDFGPAIASSAPASSRPPDAASMRLAQNTAGSPTTAAAGAGGIPACDQPGGLGLSRIVEIYTTGGPGFGFEHFKQYDFLHDREVVLTFDDGPWPDNTPAVLKALADNCLKATFFEIGEHAVWHPEIAKQLAAAGNTIAAIPGRTRIWQKTRTPATSSRPSRRSKWGSVLCMRRSLDRSRRSSAFPTSSTRPRCKAILGSATSRPFRPTSTRSTSRCAGRSR